MGDDLAALQDLIKITMTKELDKSRLLPETPLPDRGPMTPSSIHPYRKLRRKCGSADCTPGTATSRSSDIFDNAGRSTSIRRAAGPSVRASTGIPVDSKIESSNALIRASSGFDTNPSTARAISLAHANRTRNPGGEPVTTVIFSSRIMVKATTSSRSSIALFTCSTTASKSTFKIAVHPLDSRFTRIGTPVSVAKYVSTGSKDTCPCSSV